MLQLPTYISLEEGEKVELIVRRYWLSYLSVLLIGMVMGFAPIIILTGLHSQGILQGELKNLTILGTSSYLLFVLAYLLTSFIDYYLDLAIVTNKKIINIEQKGLFVRHIDHQPLSKIEDVSSHQERPFQTIFGYGDVNIQTAGETSNVHLPLVKNPQMVAQKIIELHRRSLPAGSPLPPSATSSLPLISENQPPPPCSTTEEKEK